MAGAIVSIAMEQLESIIRQEIEQRLTMVTGVQEIRKIIHNFQVIQAVIEDAEQKQAKNYAVRHWLDKLKTVSYEIDDVLDEWNTAILKLQIEKKKKKKEVCFVFPSCFNLSGVVLRHDISIKLKGLCETLDDITVEKDMHNFRTVFDSPEFERVETTSFIDNYAILGRDKEKNILVRKLLSGFSNEQGKDIPVISLLGMAGIGKTTLAQLVYNDEQVKNHFEKRIWVCVSNPWDEIRIAKGILASFTYYASDLSDDLESLLDSIHECVQKRKFLLVLDDVWTEDYSKWELLYKALSNGDNGSRILVTTRNETVAHRMDSIDIITIKELTEENCWSLFSVFAFRGRPYEECKRLEEIGRIFVGKCQGLPLAVKIIGAYLRFQKEWEAAVDCEMWELKAFERDMFRPLLLSYYDLPLELRNCFSDCAVFPKDHLISKEELIKLWMAQGYLGMEITNETIESKGETYFNMLAARCFFQDFEKDDDDRIIRCKMHKVVHDFATYLTRNECFIMEVNDHEGPSRIYSEDRLLHITLMLSKGATTFPDSICSAKRLRSHLLHYGVTNCSSVSKVLPKLFGSLTCLRAVGMSGKFRYENLVIEIPREIGKLLHLRYLNLSFLKIEELPESLCELFNLQTLELNSCTNLKKLPQEMGKLINLRHLGNNEMSSLSYMPKGIDKLTCLHTLSEFVVSGVRHENEASTLQCLRNLNHLRGSLTIKGLGNVTNVDEAVEAKLRNKENLLSLYLNFKKDEEEENANDHEQSTQVLEALQPPLELKRLEIRDYSGKTVFPNWMTLLTNLKRLSLHDCINLEYLPPLGKLSSLESLSLCSMTGVKRVGNEFLGIDCNDVGTLPSSSSSSSSLVIFPKLKTLKFLNMDEWEEWELSDRIIIMPCLRSLSLVYCPMLKMLPDHLLLNVTLEELNISWCPNLKQQYIDAEDWFKISSIPKIMIDFDYVKGHNDR